MCRYFFLQYNITQRDKNWQIMIIIFFEIPTISYNSFPHFGFKYFITISRSYIMNRMMNKILNIVENKKFPLLSPGFSELQTNPIAGWDDI